MAAEQQLANWSGAVDNRFEFGKNAYLEAVPDLANANATAQNVSTGELQTAAGLGGMTDYLGGRTKTFGGMQDQYADKAFSYNSPENQQKAVAKSNADIESSFGNVADQSNRQLQRMGVNPSSGRSLSLTNQLGLSKATALAGGSAKALQSLESVADERQKTAIGFGANLPSQTAQMGQSAAYVGNSSVNAGTAPLTNRLAFNGGIDKLYADNASGNANLWQSQNVSANTAAQLAATQQIADNQSQSQFYNGLLKTGVSLVTPNDKGQTGWDTLKSIYNSW